MLLAPMRYWKVRHPAKRHWDVTLPLIGAAVLTAALMFWPQLPSPYGATGFLAGLQNLYAILGGFFVAALTLVSTASADSLDRPLSGTPKVTFGLEETPLDRRRFLCLLFGYLAFSCFGLYLAGLVADLIVPGLRTMIPHELQRWCSGAFLFIYTFWLSHVFTSTLVGLYYFTDRLPRRDVEILRDKPSSR